jgi:uncharacterized membrane protein YsdA (DUF1294 family)
MVVLDVVLMALISAAIVGILAFSIYARDRQPAING